MFTVDANYQIQQSLAQFFVAQLINLEWVQSSGGEHQVFAANSDVEDGAGHELVTAYAVKRPDGNWGVMAVNRDQQNAHRVRIDVYKRQLLVRWSVKRNPNPVRVLLVSIHRHQRPLSIRTLHHLSLIHI